MAKSKDIPAPFWKRVIAYIIDAVIITFVVAQPFTSRLQKFGQDRLSSFATIFQGAGFKDLVGVSILIGILTLIYWTFLEYKFGQTIGKILLRIKVQSLDKKQKLTLMQIIVRNVTKLSSLLLVLDTLYMLPAVC